jgi:hypothetical protein
MPLGTLIDITAVSAIACQSVSRFAMTGKIFGVIHANLLTTTIFNFTLIHFIECDKSDVDTNVLGRMRLVAGLKDHSGYVGR